jgi:rSAM/selenodomain-associated transferase 2
MGAVKQSAVLVRLACGVVTIVALVIVFRRIDPATLWETLRTMRVGWFLAAIAMYGLIFLPSSWRWHLALRQADVSVHPGAAVRLSVIGHFFYTILFGAAGGDTAKSAVYARWYRLPLPEVLAAAPLDRLIGFAGLLAFGLVAVLLGAFGGGFARFQRVSLDWPKYALLVILVLLIIGTLVMFRAKAGSARARFAGTFVHGGKRLLRTPGVFLQGLLCAFLVHVGLNSALAFNLEAVTDTPVPWAQLAWTFPVICIISALPITVAGLGVREGAALALLGLYGIRSEDAVAASLLTLTTALFWAAIGAWLLWREDRRQHSGRRAPKTISAVIPALNEAEALPETIQRARTIPELCEIIVVDGGSSDGTASVAEQLGCRVLSSPPGRGGQMRLGAEQAKGDVILLLHADTWLPPHAGKALLNCLRDECVVAGGFWKTFRDASPLLLGSRCRCAIRLCLGRRVLGDQAMFIRRDILAEVGGIPDMPLMEEFELCRRLRKTGRLALADATIITSARRFEKFGVLRTYFRMWWVTTQYRLGVPACQLQRTYDKE